MLHNIFGIGNGLYFEADGKNGSGGSTAEGEEIEDTLEETTDNETAEEGGDGADRNTGKQNEQTVPLFRLNQVIAERNDARKKLQAQEKAQRKAEEDRLKQEKNFEKLYNDTQPELERLRGVETSYTEMEETLQAVLDSQMEGLSEQAKNLVPADLPVVKQLKYIAANRSFLVKPAAFDVAAGQRGSGRNSTKPKATPEQIEIAKSFGMSVEEYLKFAGDSTPAEDTK